MTRRLYQDFIVPRGSIFLSSPVVQLPSSFPAAAENSLFALLWGSLFSLQSLPNRLARSGIEGQCPERLEIRTAQPWQAHSRPGASSPPETRRGPGPAGLSPRYAMDTSPFSSLPTPNLSSRPRRAEAQWKREKTTYPRKWGEWRV